MQALIVTHSHNEEWKEKLLQKEYGRGCSQEAWLLQLEECNYTYGLFYTKCCFILWLACLFVSTFKHDALQFLIAWNFQWPVTKIFWFLVASSPHQSLIFKLFMLNLFIMTQNILWILAHMFVVRSQYAELCSEILQVHYVVSLWMTGIGSVCYYFLCAVIWDEMIAFYSMSHYRNTRHLQQIL